MEVIAYTHLAMAYEEANVNLQNQEPHISNGVNRKQRNLAYKIGLLLLIWLGANFNLQNNSLAQGNNLSGTYIIARNSEESEQAEDIPVYWNTVEDPNAHIYILSKTTLDLLYCRKDNWCYLEGIFEGEIFKREDKNSRKGYFHTSTSVWISKQNICEIPTGNSSDTDIQDCSIGIREKEDIIKSSVGLLELSQKSNFFNFLTKNKTIVREELSYVDF